MKTTFTSLALALSLGLLPASALAQSSPAPAPPPSPVSEPSAAPAMTMAPAPATAAPVQTMAPAPAMTKAPATSGGTAKPTAAQIKKIPAGSLSVSDLRYGLTHPLQEANKVRAMKKVSFDKLRVYRLSAGLKSILKVGDANADIPALAILGPGVEIAQTTGPLPGTNGSNSPIAYLQYVLANINVSNALNNVNVLNNANVNVGVSLQDVLNGNKISIGQVAGIFVNGLGIITTITK
jgi:hypothetical protein